MGDPPKPGTYTLLGYLGGAVAALALFITNLETLHDAWCNNIGTFCSPEPNWAKSDIIYVSSGGTSNNRSDVCKDQKTIACARPSGSDKQLQPEIVRFEVIERSGAVYLDGKPINTNPIGTNNIGWFMRSDRISRNEVCATVFARTSACETRVFLRGQLAVREVPK